MIVVVIVVVILATLVGIISIIAPKKIWDFQMLVKGWQYEDNRAEPSELGLLAIRFGGGVCTFMVAITMIVWSIIPL